MNVGGRCLKAVGRGRPEQLCHLLDRALCWCRDYPPAILPAHQHGLSVGNPHDACAFAMQGIDIPLTANYDAARTAPVGGSRVLAGHALNADAEALSGVGRRAVDDLWPVCTGSACRWRLNLARTRRPHAFSWRRRYLGSDDHRRDQDESLSTKVSRRRQAGAAASISGISGWQV